MATGQPLGQMIIELDLNSTNFEKSLTSTNKAIKSAEKEMKANLAVMNAADDQYGAMTKQVEGLNKIMRLNESRIEQLKRKREELLRTEDASSEAVQNLNNEINTAVTRQAKLQQSLQRTQQNMQRFEQETREAESTVVKFEQKLTKIADTADKVGSTLTKTLTPAMGALGAAAGKVGLDVDKSTAKLRNAFGLTAEEAKEAQKNVNAIWSDGFGENMEAVTNAVLQTKQNIRNLNDTQLQDITKQAIALADLFDADINEVTRSAQNLMKNFGITAEEAFDMLTKSGQQGLNFSNELFDNVSEYAGLWKNLGFSAEEMFGTLVSGAQEGVYNLDYLNDMVKEFGIRLVDGSDSTSQAMTAMFSPEGFYDFADNLKKNGKSSEEYLEVCKKLGKDYADIVVTSLKKGGKEGEDAWKGLEFNMGRGREIIDGITDGSVSGQQAMKEIAQEISNIDDPMEQAQLGVALFGTKFEDLGTDAALAMMTAGKSLEDFDGAAAEVAKNVELTFGQQATALMREYGQSLMPLGETMLDLAKIVLPSVAEGAETVSEFFEGMSDNGKKIVVVAGALGLAIGPALKIIASLMRVFSNGRTTIQKFTNKLLGSTTSLNTETTALNANTNALRRNNRQRGLGGGGTGGNNRNNRQDTDTDTSNRRGNRRSGSRIGKFAKGAGAAGAVIGVGTLAYELSTGSGTKESIGGALGGSLGGIGGGAAAGAALGSIVPGIGTAIGGIAGGIIGGIAGDKIGAAIGKNFDDKDKKEKVLKKAEKGATLNLNVKGVSKDTKTALNEYNKLYEGAKNSLNQIEMSNTVINAKIKKNTIKEFTAMKDNVLATVKTRHKTELEEARKALESNKQLTQKQKDDAIAKLQSQQQKEISSLNSKNARVKQILESASKEKRALTTAEKNEITRINNELYDTKINKTAKSEEEINKINKQRSKQRQDITTKEMLNTIKTANKEYKDTVSAANKKYKEKVKNAETQYRTLGVISKKEYDKLVTTAKNEKNKTISEAEKKRDSVVKRAEEQKERSVKQSKEQKERAIKNAKEETSGIAKAWDSVLGFFTGVSDWFVKLFGGSSAGKPPTYGSTTSANQGKVTSGGQSMISAYAKGTVDGSHKGGTALVGEIGPELSYIPGNGYQLLGMNGPSLYDLPRGTAVLPHDKTMGILGSYNFPAYAKGTGDDNIFEKLGNYVKGGVGYLKGKAVDTYDFVNGGASSIYEKLKSAFNFNVAFPKTMDNWTPSNMGKWVGKKAIDLIEESISNFSLSSAYGGEIGPSGGSASSWSSKIQQAASEFGISLSARELQGIIAQIHRESGGNQNIVQSSAVRDINTANGNPARGLLQYIPQTFAAYKLRGHENIYNGYDQLLAFFNNANWRRDLPYGKSGWGPSGKRIRGYKNGGIITKEQLAMIGEGDKKEVVIPLQPSGGGRSRALDLLAYAAENLLGKGSASTTQTVEGNNVDISALVKQNEQMINLLSQLVSKNNDVYLDSKIIKKGQDALIKKENKITKFSRGSL